MELLGIIAEVLVCIFAVYGVYAILCRILAHTCYKGDLSIALHLGQEEAQSAEAGLRRATVVTEAQSGKMGAPVILVDEETDESALAGLRAGGCDVYRKMD